MKATTREASLKLERERLASSMKGIETRPPHLLLLQILTPVILIPLLFIPKYLSQSNSMQRAQTHEQQI